MAIIWRGKKRNEIDGEIKRIEKKPMQPITRIGKKAHANYGIEKTINWNFTRLRTSSSFCNSLYV